MEKVIYKQFKTNKKYFQLQIIFNFDQLTILKVVFFYRKINTFDFIQIWMKHSPYTKKSIYGNASRYYASLSEFYVWFSNDGIYLLKTKYFMNVLSTEKYPS